MSMNTITQEYLKECLDYDPGTGVFTWRERPREHFPTEAGWKQTNSRLAGKKTGSTDANGYSIIGISGNYKAHRLAYLYMTGEWPAYQIDHINGVRDDNRWCNIRDVPQFLNMRNRKLNSNNKTGLLGVRWRWQSNGWVSIIRVNGKPKHLGTFYTLFEAACARKSAELGRGFHENHGRKAA